MTEVLITGVNGFVGPYVAQNHIEHGAKVHAIAGVNSPTHRNTADFESYQALDLRDPEATSSIDMSRIDSIIHLAGMVSVVKSFSSPNQYENANRQMQLNLLNVALQQDVRPHFVVASSGGVYDGGTVRPSLETSDTRALSPYVESKLLQEKMIEDYSEKYGFSYTIARGFNQIGPGLGKKFLLGSVACQLAVAQRTKRPELIVGNLDTARDYIDVRDMAVAYRLLADPNVSNGIYNVCSGIAVTGHQLLAHLSDIADCRPVVVQDPELIRSTDAQLSVGSYKKIHKTMGWRPLISLHKTLRDLYNYEVASFQALQT